MPSLLFRGLPTCERWNRTGRRLAVTMSADWQSAKQQTGLSALPARLLEPDGHLIALEDRAVPEVHVAEPDHVIGLRADFHGASCGQGPLRLKDQENRPCAGCQPLFLGIHGHLRVDARFARQADPLVIRAGLVDGVVHLYED